MSHEHFKITSMTNAEMDFAMQLMGSEFSSSGAGNRAAHCPLAVWTHHRGKDKRPSLMAKSGHPAYFKCWACQEKGQFKTLARKYGEYSGDWRAYKYVLSLEGETAPTWGKMERPFGAPLYAKKEKEEVREITEEMFEKNYLQEIPNYAWERGCTKDQILRWELGYDAYEKRMIFPTRDQFGKLVGISGRDLLPKIEHIDRGKYKHYWGFRKELFFWGENFRDPKNPRVFIAEGFFDVLNMERYGLKNVLSPYGTAMSWDQKKKLRDWASEIIFLPDGNDKGQGLEFAEKTCISLLPLGKTVRIAGVKANPCFIYRMNPTRWELSDHRFQIIDGLKGKDPGEWTMDDLRLAFNHVGTIALEGGIEAHIGPLDVGVSTSAQDLLSGVFE